MNRIGLGDEARRNLPHYYAKLTFLAVITLVMGFIFLPLYSCSPDTGLQQGPVLDKTDSPQEFQPAMEYEGGPRILFKEESADIGEMTSGMSRSYSFRFKNIGDEPLEIKEISVRAIEGC